MSSFASNHVGDTVYPAALLQGTLCVMAKMPMEQVEMAFDYLLGETGQQHSALVPDGFAIEMERRAGGIFYQTSRTADLLRQSCRIKYTPDTYLSPSFDVGMFM